MEDFNHVWGEAKDFGLTIDSSGNIKPKSGLNRILARYIDDKLILNYSTIGNMISTEDFDKYAIYPCTQIEALKLISKLIN